MYDESTAVEGSKKQSDLQQTEFSKNSNNFAQNILPWLIMPDICLWIHALDSKLQMDDQANIGIPIWNEIVQTHNGLAHSSGASLLVRAYDSERDNELRQQSLHIDSTSPYNLFLIFPMTDSYEIQLCSESHHIGWEDNPELATTPSGHKRGYQTEHQPCFAGSMVESIKLNTNQILVAHDCLVHGGGKAGKKAITAGQGHLDSLVDVMMNGGVNWCKCERKKGQSYGELRDASIQCHVHVLYEGLSYGQKMGSTNTKTYNQKTSN